MCSSDFIFFFFEAKTKDQDASFYLLTLLSEIEKLTVISLEKGYGMVVLYLSGRTCA